MPFTLATPRTLLDTGQPRRCSRTTHSLQAAEFCLACAADSPSTAGAMSFHDSSASCCASTSQRFTVDRTTSTTTVHPPVRLSGLPLVRCWCKSLAFSTVNLLLLLLLLSSLLSFSQQQQLPTLISNSNSFCEDENNT